MESIGSLFPVCSHFSQLRLTGALETGPPGGRGRRGFREGMPCLLLAFVGDNGCGDGRFGGGGT